MEPKVIGIGSYGRVELIKTRGKSIARKHFSHSTEGIEQNAAREIHCINQMKDSICVVKLLGIDIKVDNGFTIASIDLEYYDGPLNEFIARVSSSERLRNIDCITKQLYEGLYTLHSRGILHRDIKPANILVKYKYNTIKNKLEAKPKCVYADFGISRQYFCTNLYEPIAMTRKVYSGWYTPPEFLVSEDAGITYDAKADVWALGITLLECYVGILDLSRFTNESDLLRGIQNLSDDHKSINVHKIVERRVNYLDRGLITHNEKEKLQSMLMFDPKERKNIGQLLDDPPKIEKLNHPLSRAETGLDKDTFNETAITIVKICQELHMRSSTAIKTLDLFQRLYTHYNFDLSDLELNCLTILSLCALIEEYKPPNLTYYAEIFNTNITVDQIKRNQIQCFELLKYTLATCETDVFVDRILDEPKPYTALLNTFENIVSRNESIQTFNYDRLTLELQKSTKS